MPLLLHIDTATEYGSVCLTRDGVLLALEVNQHQKDHAAFIQPAIQQMMLQKKMELSQLDAVAVSNGPGSYTGLRVGLSSAKGICYALQKPLILVNTLAVMAVAAREVYCASQPAASFMLAPMIDARRMEVYTAVYDQALNEVKKPAAVILDTGAFEAFLSPGPVVFTGSGATKFAEMAQHPNAVFLPVQHNAGHMQQLAEKMFHEKQFADLAYSEPFYLKEFFTPAGKLKSN